MATSGSEFKQVIPAMPGDEEVWFWWVDDKETGRPEDVEIHYGPLVAFLVVVRFDGDGDPLTDGGNTYAIGADGNVHYGWRRDGKYMLGEAVFDNADAARRWWVERQATKGARNG